MLTGRGGRPLRPDTVTSRFNRLAVAAGVRPIGPYQVRQLLVSSLPDEPHAASGRVTASPDATKSAM